MLSHIDMAHGETIVIKENICFLVYIRPRAAHVLQQKSGHNN